MYENFEKLPKEKRERILQICFEEFAQHGYQEASTNRIIEKAGISKGILFHYFGSKKDLFLYLFDYNMEFFQKQADMHAGEVTSTDLFERLKMWSFIKVKMSLEAPEMSDFLTRAFLTLPDELRVELQGRYSKIATDNVQRFMQGADFTSFREGVDVRKVMEVIGYLRDGVGKKLMEKYRGREGEIKDDYDKLLQEFDEYFELLKWGCYKRES